MAFMLPTTPVHPHLWNECLASHWTNNLLGRGMNKKTGITRARHIYYGRKNKGTRNDRASAPAANYLSLLEGIEHLSIVTWVRSVHLIFVSTSLFQLFHLSLTDRYGLPNFLFVYLHPRPFNLYLCASRSSFIINLLTLSMFYWENSDEL